MPRYKLHAGISLSVLFAVLALACHVVHGAEVIQYRGDGSDLQQVLDETSEHAVIVCDASTMFTFSSPLMIHKALTLQGLHARLPEKLGETALIEVKAEGVTLLDLELHGNYDSVPQDQRSTLIWISKGDFRVERCRFFDGSKDGVMITPESDQGDLVGGVVRDIEAHRMGRDAVSISGGNAGSKVRNVTVENVSLETGYHRGAVEVSDGTQNIAVRNVRAENCVYAVDVQDHRGQSAANVNVLFEDIKAIDCKHIVRTANSPRGHANLVLRNLVATRCERPLVISNTENVVLQGLRIEEHEDGAGVPVDLRNCHGVAIRGLTMADDDYVGDRLRSQKCTGVTVVETETPAASPSAKP